MRGVGLVTYAEVLQIRKRMPFANCLCGKIKPLREAPPFKIFPDFKSDFSNSRDPSPSTNRTKRQMPGQGAAAVKARPNVRTDAKGSHAGQRSNKAEEYDMLVDQALTIIGSQPSQTLGTCSCSQH